jgi:phenylacetate-CoA ligase
MWLGRSWYGVTPSSRLFLLWGHSHLLGRGFVGWLNGWKRRWKDFLSGYRRVSAYDLQPSALREAARRLIRFKPNYIIGYAVALDLFCRANQDLRDQLRQIQAKVVVGAAEAFPSPESESLLRDLFGCPVAMEYGSVETGLIAHSLPEGGYQVFWRTYFVEADPGPDGRVGHQVRVTSLYPRCVPLIRYDMGDEIEVDNSTNETLLGVDHFRRVIGRCNDYVETDDGAIIHSEAFTHAVRSCAAIAGYQVVQTGSEIRIDYTAPEPLSDAQADEIVYRLCKVRSELSRTKLNRVNRLAQTAAGKTRMVIRR